MPSSKLSDQMTAIFKHQKPQSLNADSLSHLICSKCLFIVNITKPKHEQEKHQTNRFTNHPVVLAVKRGILALKSHQPKSLVCNKLTATCFPMKLENY